VLVSKFGEFLPLFVNLFSFSITLEKSQTKRILPSYIVVSTQHKSLPT